jgi:ferrochelatase
MKNERVAIVLFNLGAPDTPAAIRPFLFNLFSDKAIIDVRQPLRWFLAKMIAGRRAREAESIYSRLGGGSPLLAHTREQAAALESALSDVGEVRVFIAMRYWHPMSDQTAAEIAKFAPGRLVLLPLYPQYSTTTTASSFAQWLRAANTVGLGVPTWSICCYPTAPRFIAAHVELIRHGLERASRAGKPRLLFSAHGLPKRVLLRGDPYVWQVERTAETVAAELIREVSDLDWTLCYQSRVGRLEWVGPSTEEEIRQAGHASTPLVVAPIAFVSEHSETLVELDIACRELADREGVPMYIRIPALGGTANFVEALGAMVRDLLRSGPGTRSGEGARLCPAHFARCPMTAQCGQ